MILSNNHYANEKSNQARFYVEKQVTMQENWDNLFNNDSLLQKLQKSALNGHLEASHFRSVCWRVFWECLSETPSKWQDEVKEKRNWYSTIRKKYVINPHQEEQKEVDLEKHHPLSLAEDSIWNKYFQDNELRTLILQDLDRLHPEIEFFQQEEIKNCLLHILFCYARENPHVSYKQGMHEILSPLIYVMYTNCTAIRDTKEQISDSMKNILNFEFIEHDAYLLFYNIMESIQPWYVDLRPIEAPPLQQQQKTNHGSSSNMFQKPDSKPVNAISNKLQLIQGSMLQKYDPDLAAHLKKMAVTPQVYGIRWVRLLFGREFSMNGLLILWDAIFADGMALELVEYIYLAMLMHLKAVLIQSDFSQCLSYLMKFPQDIDSRLILRRAVELKQMKNKPIHHHRKQQNQTQQRPTDGTAIGNRQTKRHPQQQQQTTARHQHKQKHGGMVGGGVKVKPSIHPVKYRLGETEEHKYAQALGSGGSSVAYKAFSKSSPGNNQYKDGSKSHFFVEDSTDGGRVDNAVQETSEIVKAEFYSDPLQGGKSNTRMVENLRERMGSGAQMISRLPNTLRDAMNSPKHPNNQAATSGVTTGSNSYINAIVEDHTRLQRQVSELKSDLDSAQTMAVYCSQKMEHYLNLMQERMFQEENFNDEIAILGFAGLKQVREILKGQDMDDVDFTDIDRHIDVARQRDDGNQDPNKDSAPIAVIADSDHNNKTDPINKDGLLTSKNLVLKDETDLSNNDKDITNQDEDNGPKETGKSEGHENPNKIEDYDVDANVQNSQQITFDDDNTLLPLNVNDGPVVDSDTSNGQSQEASSIDENSPNEDILNQEDQNIDKTNDDNDQGSLVFDPTNKPGIDDCKFEPIQPDSLGSLVDGDSESIMMNKDSLLTPPQADSNSKWVDPLQCSNPLNADTDS